MSLGFATELPEHLLAHIFSPLSFQDKLRVSWVCKRWRGVFSKALGLWATAEMDVNKVSKAIWATCCKDTDAHIFCSVLQICRWLSKRSLDGGLTSLKLSASFEEGTGKEKEDCCNQQLTQGLAFLLPTLAATVGNSCVPLHLTLSGSAALSCPLFIPSIGSRLNVHDLVLERMDTSAPCSIWMGLAQLTQLTALHLAASSGQSLPAIGVVPTNNPAAGCFVIADALAKLTRLQVLKLDSEAPLHPLPYGPQLGHLTRLEMNGGLSSEVFSQLSHIPSLESLSLTASGDSEHRVLAMPARAMACLEHLRHVSLTSVTLAGSEEQMRGLGLLTGMERLELQKCRLERDEAGPTFTACLGRMHRLVDLCMQGSTIYAILSLGMQLERLSLAAMDLTNLPGMSALCRLQHLSIACNQLRKVPEGLQHLTCLSYLDMSMQSRRFQMHGPLTFLAEMPCLATLIVQPQPQGHEWDAVSIFRIAELMEADQASTGSLRIGPRTFWQDLATCSWHALS